jgi:hypothetical protein
LEEQKSLKNIRKKSEDIAVHSTSNREAAERGARDRWNEIKDLLQQTHVYAQAGMELSQGGKRANFEELVDEVHNSMDDFYNKKLGRNPQET